MQIIVVRCGAPHVEIPAGYQVVDVSAVPTRQELRPLDEAAAAILPEDPTPSLEEISKRPDVEHLGAPGPAPQPVPEALRVIVVGTDAALSDLVARLSCLADDLPEVDHVLLNPVNAWTGGVDVLDAEISIHAALTRKDADKRVMT